MADNHHHNDNHARGHDHDSHHHHGHAHQAPVDFGRVFLIAITLNIVFVAVEFTFGIITNSTALMADAGHNLSDVLGLILAWVANRLARRAPTTRYTYGLRSSSILAALANAVLLLIACGAIGWEAIQRLVSGTYQAIPSTTVMAVAALGIVINGLSAWLFMRGSKNDLNIRGAYLHMVADAVISLGVVLAGAAMFFTQWYWIDSIVSLIVIGVIVTGTWKLLRDSFDLALGAVPKTINFEAVKSYLESRPGVTNVHDLHIWAMSTTETALTAHLVIPSGHLGDAQMDAIARELLEKYSIMHSTLQIAQKQHESVCALVKP